MPVDRGTSTVADLSFVIRHSQKVGRTDPIGGNCHPRLDRDFALDGLGTDGRVAAGLRSDHWRSRSGGCQDCRRYNF